MAQDLHWEKAMKIYFQEKHNMSHLPFVRLMLLVLLLIVGSTGLLSAQSMETYIFGGGTSHGTAFDAHMPGGAVGIQSR
jgi:hypothetical protein